MQSVPDFSASNCKIPDLSICRKNLKLHWSLAPESGTLSRCAPSSPGPPPIPQVTCSKVEMWETPNPGLVALHIVVVEWTKSFSFHLQSYGVWDYKWGYNRMQRWNQKMLSSQDCVQSRLSISRLSLITAACNQHYTCNQSFNQRAKCISNTQTNTFITKMHIHIKSTWNVKQSTYTKVACSSATVPECT